MDEKVRQKNNFSFGSGIVRGEKSSGMVGELCDQALLDLGGDGEADIAFFFMTGHFCSEAQKTQELLAKRLKARVLEGCTAASIIVAGKEVEAEPAMSLFLAHLPGTNKFPFSIKQSDLELMSDPEKCREYFGVKPEDSPTFFILPDPFSFDITSFLEKIQKAYPGVPVIGGMASGAQEPGGNVLFWSEGICEAGAVGVVLTGNIRISPLVSQGCRPFGEPAVITDAQENVILSLAGRPALEFLEDNYRQASARDQVLARQALFIGALADEYKPKPGRGDFVIRNVIGLDRDTGALAISDYARVGNTVQFHVRDADTADEDLKHLCEDQKLKLASGPVQAALIFSCNGRGSNMFRQRNHDVATLETHLGKFPTAGFFCAGELGPIGKKNFMHSFTASVALFYGQ